MFLKWAYVCIFVFRCQLLEWLLPGVEDLIDAGGKPVTECVDHILLAQVGLITVYLLPNYSCSAKTYTNCWPE